MDGTWKEGGGGLGLAWVTNYSLLAGPFFGSGRNTSLLPMSSLTDPVLLLHPTTANFEHGNCMDSNAQWPAGYCASVQI